MAKLREYPILVVFAFFLFFIAYRELSIDAVGDFLLVAFLLLAGVHLLLVVITMFITPKFFLLAIESLAYFIMASVAFFVLYLLGLFS